MAQALLFVALQLVGVLVSLAFGPVRRLHLICALGLAVGLAAVVIPAMLLGAAGVALTPLTVGGIVAALVAGAVALGRRRGAWPDRAGRRVIAAWAVGFAVVAAGASAVNLAVLSYDSHVIVFLAQIVADEGGFSTGLLHELGDRGGFLVVAHAWASWLGLEFLYGLAPMLALSLAAGFAVALWHGVGRLGLTGRRRAAAVAVVTAALVTVHLFDLHAVYVHENLGSALYLLGFVALFWLAEVDDDPGLLPAAFVALAAFALMRIENPLGAALVAAVVVVPSRLPRPSVTRGLAAVALVVLVWNLVLGEQLPERGRALDLRRCLVMGGALLAVLGGWLAVPRLPARWVGRAPWLIAGALGVGLGLAFAVRPAPMLASADAMARNLASTADWGVAWLAVAALAAVGLALPRPPLGERLAVAVAGYFALVLLFSFGRGAYTVGSSDSAMRMALHVLPIALLWAGLKLAAAFADEPA